MMYHTPLRYPGGKGKIADFIKAILKENRLLDGCYIEPYAGGAAVAVELLLQEYVSHIHINDLNRSIYAFWHSVLNDTDELCKIIVDVPVTMDTWYRQKLVQKNAQAADLLELGFSTFFLNRTNRSGIIKGGVIGGKSQDGKWRLDARYKTKDLVRRIESIARYNKRISLYNMDAADFIINHLNTLPAKALVYLDPPFYEKGEGLYDSYYIHDDHVKIAEIITKNIDKQYWMVSYDDVPQVRNLYKDYPSLPYQLNYSAADRYKGSEIMFFCENLLIPKNVHPVYMKAA